MKGFSLVEVLVAMALLATTATGLAGLMSLSTRVIQDSRVDMVETMAAAGKMAELRALTWAYDAGGAGVPVSDPGLALSPANALSSNVAGFVDFVDASGARVGAGVTAPPQGVYVRRWSIASLVADPAHTLVLQVVAARVTTPFARDVHVVSLLARTAQ